MLLCSQARHFLADLADNMVLSRLPVVTDDARACMDEYRAVRAILEGGDS